MLLEGSTTLGGAVSVSLGGDADEEGLMENELDAVLTGEVCTDDEMSDELDLEALDAYVSDDEDPEDKSVLVDVERTDVDKERPETDEDVAELDAARVVELLAATRTELWRLDLIVEVLKEVEERSDEVRDVGAEP